MTGASAAGRAGAGAPAAAGILLASFAALAAAQRSLPVDAPGAVVEPLDGWTVDLNSASTVELALLPRVGPTLAGRIVASRGSDGPFRSVDDLERVTGIGPVTLQRLRRWACTAEAPAAAEPR